MTDNRTYYWKNLQLDKKYYPISNDNNSQVTTIDLDFFFIKKHLHEYAFIDNFISSYDAIQISKKHKKLIDDLLKSYSLTSLQDEFYILAAIIQKEYIHYYENPKDLNEPLVKDFQEASKNIKVLFEILKEKLNNGNSLIKSASFNLGKNKTIKNFFIVEEILDILISSYGLTLDNFDLVLTDNIERYLNISMKKFDEYYKWLCINGFYNFIKSKTHNNKIESYNLKFVIIFLQISQIPVNPKHFEVPDSNNIKNYFDDVLIKYVWITLNRQKNLN